MKADFVFAVRQLLVDSRIFQDVRGDSVHIFLLVVPGSHGHQQIQITDGFATAAQGTSRRHGLNSLAGLRNIGDQLLRFFVRDVDADAA